MEYSLAISQSAALVANSIDALHSQHVPGASGASLDSLKRALVLDNVNLVSAKTSSKSNLNSLNVDFIARTTKSNSSTTNPLLAKLQTQSIQNQSTHNLIGETLALLPPNTSSNKFTAGLKSLQEITKLLECNNLEELDIDASTISELENNLALDNIDKFKLIKLSNDYYNTQLKSLNDMNAKWLNELSTVNSFISNEVATFNTNLKLKINQLVDTTTPATSDLTAMDMLPPNGIAIDEMSSSESDSEANTNAPDEESRYEDGESPLPNETHHSDANEHTPTPAVLT